MATVVSACSQPSHDQMKGRRKTCDARSSCRKRPYLVSLRRRVDSVQSAPAPDADVERGVAVYRQCRCGKSAGQHVQS